ncbi:DUF2076 domain-containing protein [Affinirhizobium pseudoryzae]|uniref:DUF2076 domain-containing protein n=1 Tax=Allorhizobium pseudoryzae TaxID=379684 RepID=UPI0013ED41BE|nr:DUF2076 domain-containing protein [Allorhizobium pseudoryzae]
MLPEERQLLTALFDRVRTAAGTPRDADAERLIADAVRAEPAAPYYLAQAVIVQEKGLEAASKRINDLEGRIRELEGNLAKPAPQPEERGFLSSIFGSSQPTRTAPPAPSRPAYPATDRGAPWSQPQGYGQASGYSQAPTGPWSQPVSGPSAGSSFLTGALGTAAGVAGGMLLANSLSGIFGHHMAGLGLGAPLSEGFGNAPVEETVINNYYGDPSNDPPQIDTGTNASANLEPDDNLQQADLDTNDTGWNDDTDLGSDDGSDFV